MDRAFPDGGAPPHLPRSVWAEWLDRPLLPGHGRTVIHVAQVAIVLAALLTTLGPRREAESPDGVHVPGCLRGVLLGADAADPAVSAPGPAPDPEVRTDADAGADRPRRQTTDGCLDHSRPRPAPTRCR